MLAKRIIPCLAVKEGQVVKGVKFRQHRYVGDIVTLAQTYNEAGADELVFYDITASSEGRAVNLAWIERIAEHIHSVADASRVLYAGADKISINSPALASPGLIDELAYHFGRQCVVVGIESMATANGYEVYQYTGCPQNTQSAGLATEDWLTEAQKRGAGEIVLNCMNQDGVKAGYDIEQLKTMRQYCHVPLIASGGAGQLQHFGQVFEQAEVDGALAASVFHNNLMTIQQVKRWLKRQQIVART